MTKSVFARSPTTRIRGRPDTPAGASGCRRTAGASRSSLLPDTRMTSLRVNGAPGRTAIGKPNQLGSEPARGFGQDEELFERRRPSCSAAKLRRRASMKPAASPTAPRRPRPACRSASGCSRCASRCTCDRSRTAARRAASRSACRRCCLCPGAHQQSRPQSRNDSTSVLQQRLVRQHRAALAHGDVMRGIEAEGRQIAEGADLAALDRSSPARRSNLRSATDRGVRANAVTAARSNGLPSVCAIMIARVRGPRALLRAASTSTL